MTALTALTIQQTKSTLAQPYVIVRGGLVENTPTVPVLDMDVLDTDRISINADVIREVQDLRWTARDLDLMAIVKECDTWLARHAGTTQALATQRVQS